MEKIEFQKEITLGYQQVDYTGHWRLSDLFSQFADVATTHAQMIGAWKPEMLNSYGWIVSKMHLVVSRPIHYEETIVIKTWPGKGSRVIYPRYYTVLDQKGHTCVEAISQWTLFDLKNRRIVIPSRMGITFPENLSDEVTINLNDSFNDEHEYKKIEDRQVRYSDIDTNQHFNNARYIEWVLDILDVERFKENYIADLAIYFKKETAPKEVLSLEKKEDGDRFYIRGVREDEVYFMVEGQWKKY